jgi:hypothetical protein
VGGWVGVYTLTFIHIHIHIYIYIYIYIYMGFELCTVDLKVCDQMILPRSVGAHFEVIYINT